MLSRLSQKSIRKPSVCQRRKNLPPSIPPIFCPVGPATFCVVSHNFPAFFCALARVCWVLAFPHNFSAVFCALANASLAFFCAASTVALASLEAKREAPGKREWMAGRGKEWRSEETKDGRMLAGTETNNWRAWDLPDFSGDLILSRLYAAIWLRLWLRHLSSGFVLLHPLSAFALQ